ncbi:MAG: HEAT repeat domain-containing protein [Nitrospinota bacterium]
MNTTLPLFIGSGYSSTASCIAMYHITGKTALFLLLFTFGAKAGEPEDVKNLLVHFHAGSPTAQRIAIKKLSLRKNLFLFPFFSVQAGHVDRVVRAHAYEGIANFSEDRALPILKNGLNDPSPLVVKSTLALFSRFISEASVKAVIPFLSKQDRSLKLLALRVIGHIGGMKTVKIVTPFLKNSDTLLRTEATKSILNIIRNNSTLLNRGFDAEFLPPVKEAAFSMVSSLLDETIPFLKENLLSEKASDKEKEYAVALFTIFFETLGEKLKTYSLFEEERFYLNKAEAISGRLHSLLKTLIRLAPSSPPVQRGLILNAIANSGLAETIPLLEEGLADPFFLVRIASAKGIASLDGADFASQIVSLTKDSNYYVRLAALEALYFLPTGQNAASLVAMLEEPENDIQYQAAKILGKNRRLSKEMIKTLFSSTDDRVRAVAIHYSGTLENQETTYSLLAKATTDTSPLVREQVVHSISSLSTGSKKVHLLLSLLAAPETFIKREVLIGIQREIQAFAGMQSRSVLKKTLNRMLRDSDSFIRRVSAELLGSVGGLNSRFRLQNLLKNERNPGVLKAAVSSLKKLDERLMRQPNAH